MGKKIALISFEVLFLGLCLYLVLQSTSLFIYATDRAKTIIDIGNVKAFFELTSDELAASYLQEIIDEMCEAMKNDVQLTKMMYKFYLSVKF